MLYRVTATNDQGIDGQVKLSSGKTVTTSHPLNDQPGFNPEEFIALAWSTCLNATLQAILESKYANNIDTIVNVTVELVKESTAPGYYFDVQAEVAIQSLPLETAEEITNLAHTRCPVSKLIHQSHSVSIRTIPWSETD